MYKVCIVPGGNGNLMAMDPSSPTGISSLKKNRETDVFKNCKNYKNAIAKMSKIEIISKRRTSQHLNMVNNTSSYWVSASKTRTSYPGKGRLQEPDLVPTVSNCMPVIGQPLW